MRLLLLVLALVLSPIGMAGGDAAAQTAGMASGVPGHCAEMDMPADDHRKPVQTIDCMSVCSAVAPSLPVVLPQRLLARSMDEPPPVHVLIGSTPERETPPPRFS